MTALRAGDRVVYTGEGRRNGQTGVVTEVIDGGAVVNVRADVDGRTRIIAASNLSPRVAAAAAAPAAGFPVGARVSYVGSNTRWRGQTGVVTGVAFTVTADVDGREVTVAASDIAPA
jgi:hypothetical protein